MDVLYIAQNLESYAFSIETILGISLSIVYVVVTSFASRKSRLVFFFPLHSTICLIFIPLWSILNNKKMKDQLTDDYLRPVKEWLESIYSKIRHKNAVVPVLY